MNRKNVIGAALVALLIGANGAVYWYQRQPSPTPPDTRQIIRRQLLSDWEDMPAVPLDEAVTALAAAVDAEPPTKEFDRFAGGGQAVGIATLNEAVKRDLIEAVGQAVTAIASAEPRALANYMDRRGMKPDRRLLATISAEDPPAKPPSDFAEAWQQLSVDPRWSALVPDAIAMNVRRKPLRHVSMIHLGRTESWAWSNQMVYPSVFGTRPTYEQVSRRDPALLADVRVLIEHDETLDGERSPYFFRYWYAEDRQKWQPLALKLVRTETAGEAPVLLF